MTEYDDSRGDALAAQRLEELFVLYRTSVVAYARRRVAAESVDDVVAETFLIAWRRLERVPADSPLPWLLAVARNVIGTQRRSAGRRDALNMRLRESSTAEAADPSSAQETGPLAEAMACLGEKDREALELVASDGLKPREAAVVLGMSSSTFRARLHRAKRRLRRLLDEQSEQHPAEHRANSIQSSHSHAPLQAKETTS